MWQPCSSFFSILNFKIFFFFFQRLSNCPSLLNHQIEKLSYSQFFTKRFSLSEKSRSSFHYAPLCIFLFPVSCIFYILPTASSSLPQYRQSSIAEFLPLYHLHPPLQHTSPYVQRVRMSGHRSLVSLVHISDICTPSLGGLKKTPVERRHPPPQFNFLCF